MVVGRTALFRTSYAENERPREYKGIKKGHKYDTNDENASPIGRHQQQNQRLADEQQAAVQNELPSTGKAHRQNYSCL